MYLLAVHTRSCCDAIHLAASLFLSFLALPLTPLTEQPARAKALRVTAVGRQPVQQNRVSRILTPDPGVDIQFPERILNYAPRCRVQECSSSLLAPHIRGAGLPTAFVSS